jgi:hypothetical protein
VLLTLLGGGGIWDADVTPDSRATALPWLGLALLAAALLGVRRLRTLLDRGVLLTFVLLAAIGLAIAVASSVPGTDSVVRAAVDHVPGAGLLRDAQKWVLPLVLLEALLLGAAADELTRRVRAMHWRAVAVVAGLAAPLILLPDAAATLRPTFEPVHYPRDWATVADIADSGTATVLPFGSYRLFAWAPGRSVLDPAPRLLPIATVVDDRLAVSGRVLRGEDPRAKQVAAALDAGADLPRRLADAGITWVVVEHETPGRLPDLSGLTLRHAGRDVSLYRVPEPVTTVHVSTARAAAVVGVDLLAVAVLLALAGWAGLSRMRLFWSRKHRASR